MFFHLSGPTALQCEYNNRIRNMGHRSSIGTDELLYLGILLASDEVEIHAWDINFLSMSIEALEVIRDNGAVCDELEHIENLVDFLAVDPLSNICSVFFKGRTLEHKQDFIRLAWSTKNSVNLDDEEARQEIVDILNKY